MALHFVVFDALEAKLAKLCLVGFQIHSVVQLNGELIVDGLHQPAG